MSAIMQLSLGVANAAGSLRQMAVVAGLASQALLFYLNSDDFRTFAEQVRSAISLL